LHPSGFVFNDQTAGDFSNNLGAVVNINCQARVEMYGR
jgi:hypothetical protein